MKNNRVIVRVSGYGDDIVPKREDFISRLKENNVRLEDLEGLIWRNVGNTECRNRTPEEMEEIWDHCTMNECVTLTSRGRIYYCSRAIAADDLECCPPPKENEYIDVRHLSVAQIAERLEPFYALPYISTCNFCDGITEKSPMVTTAAQMVKKDLSLELYFLERRLRESGAEYNVLTDWLKLIQQNYRYLIYEENFQKVLNCTLDVYKAIADGIDAEKKAQVLSLWNQFHDRLFQRYAYQVEDMTQTLEPEQIRYYKRIGKNTIHILVVRDETASVKADIILDPDDIRKEILWEKEKNGYSVLRYAFNFERF